MYILLKLMSSHVVTLYIYIYIYNITYIQYRFKQLKFTYYIIKEERSLYF